MGITYGTRRKRDFKGGLELCDFVVKIEMIEGIKSFNVSVAASIMMYQFKHPN